MVGAVLPSLSGLTGGLLMVAGVTVILAAQFGNGCYLNASYMWAVIKKNTIGCLCAMKIAPKG